MNTSVVEWLIIALSGWMTIPFLRASCMSTRNTERPCVFFSTSSIGVVRASSSIRSECSAREIQTFWPDTR